MKTDNLIQFSQTVRAQRINEIVITAPEILKGKKLGEIISINNMNEIGDIMGFYDQLPEIDTEGNDMERNGSVDTTGTANPPKGAPHD